MLFPQELDYKEIDLMVGFGVHRDRGEDVARFDTLEEAKEARRQLRRRYPPNRFRYVSPIERDDDDRYRFKISLTRAGVRALSCSSKFWSSDERGCFNEEATVRFWLERINFFYLTAIESNIYFTVRDIGSWIEEPWASRVKQAFALYRSGIKTLRSGKPDYDYTVKYWLDALVHQARISDRPAKIAAWRRKGYWLSWWEEPWAQPLLRGLSLAEKLILVDSSGQANYDATVEYWLHIHSVNLLAEKNLLLSWDEEWAVPIQERIMELLMKQTKVPLLR